MAQSPWVAVGAVFDGEPLIEARLLIEPNNKPQFRPVRVGVLFAIAPGWHVYWRNPGETGLPTELSWSADQADVGPTRWPAPSPFRDSASTTSLLSFGYTNEVLLTAEARPRERSHPRGSIAVDAEVLVCAHECIPARFHLERPLAPKWADADVGALFEKYAALVPVPAEELGLDLEVYYSQSAIRPGDRFDAAIAVRSCRGQVTGSGDEGCVRYEPASIESHGVVFFPHSTDPIELTTGRVFVHPTATGLHWVELTGRSDPDEPIARDRLQGVLVVTSPEGSDRVVEVDLPLPRAEPGEAVVALGTPWRLTTSAAPRLHLLEAMLLALLGGLVLNLMPCVLPVLAIKVFSLSELTESRALSQGVAYTGGIVASMLALGTCVIALQMAGQAVGWGFQFQEPIYLAAISAVLVAFALNLFGVFEVQLGTGALGAAGQTATGLRRSFFEGLLAVALATPCSAPFLGTAVGFAFASEPHVILAIFVAIGLGLAAPFALVSAVPSWARFVPRSGPWMGAVRALLGFSLLATVLWLLWIFGGSAGSSGLVELIGFLLALSFGLWGFGLVQRSIRPRLTLAAGVAVLAFAAIGSNSVSTRVMSPDGLAQAPHTSTPRGWEPWSASAVATTLASGRPAFVRFTADWCITCKVNERVVLNDPVARDELARGDFALFEADWTQRDETIRLELARHGRAGVPLYLVYHPTEPENPQVLPELLTLHRLQSALQTAAQQGGLRDRQTAKYAQPAGR